MIGAARHLCADRGGAAAVEMALVMPLLLIIMCGSVELGNYFMNEHALVKGVRDGARFAARQSFTLYTCSTVDPAVVTNTKNVVRSGYLSGGTDRLANWASATFAVTTSCTTTAGGQTMSGLYKGHSGGAQTVTVTATVPYQPVLSAFGWSGAGLSIYAQSQAAVAGI